MELADIIEKHDKVLIDNSVLHVLQGVSLPKVLYHSKRNLFYDSSIVLKIISFTNSIVDCARNSEKVLTIEEIIEEMSDLLNIINENISYHQTHFLERKWGKKMIFKRGSKRAFVLRPGDSVYNDVDGSEEARLIYLDRYALHLSDLIRLLSGRMVRFTREDILEQTRCILLEKNPNIVDCGGRKEKIDRDSDRKLFTTGYELADSGENVAIISNDRHFRNLFFGCFYGNILKLPSGRMVLYGRADNSCDAIRYIPKFDTEITKAEGGGIAEKRQKTMVVGSCI
ncbi:MAG: hypothetical protein N3D20_02425 [Candidatus Pacearchaeota archaeon]|nr:hypothetical protein [Candidatus Pacearchaeota archaeon]